MSMNEPTDMVRLREALGLAMNASRNHSTRMRAFREVDAALDELEAARGRLAQMEDVLRTILAHADKASLILWGHPETCAKYYDAPDSCNCGLDAVNAIQESARALLDEETKTP